MRETMVGAWAKLALLGVVAARAAVATLGEAAGRRLVAAHAGAYRVGDLELIGEEKPAEGREKLGRSPASGGHLTPERSR